MSAALLAGRAGAVLALVSAGLHLTLLDTSSLGSLVMAAMALACLPCAWHLWRQATPRVWRLVLLADVTMLLVHVQLSAGEGHAMHHAGAPMWLPLAVVGAQLALGAGVLVRTAAAPRAT